MKKILQYLLILIACTGFNPDCRADKNVEILKAAAGHYIEFLKLVGKSEEKAYLTRIPELFAPDCKVVVNGKTVVSSRDDFGSHFNRLKKKMGTWTIDTLDTIISAEDRASVVRYVYKTSKKKTFIIIVILRYDPKEQITEINEVYNSLKSK